MRVSRLLLASLLSLGAACGGASTAAPPPSPAPVAAGDPACPVAVPGTSATVEDTDVGAALVFVTTGDVGELRRRVAAMAERHNAHHGAMAPLPTGDEAAGGHTGHGDHAGHGMDHGGHAGHGMDHGDHAGGMVGVHSRATAEDIDGGARLVFVAMPDGVGALQTELRAHARHLSAGTCAMPPTTATR